MKRPEYPLVVNLLQNVRSYPRRVAFISDGREISFNDCGLSLRATAGRLKQSGIGQGDRVVICAPNSPELAIAYFAIHAVGAVAIPVHPDSPEDSLRFVVEDCLAKLVLFGARRPPLPIPAANLSDFVLRPHQAGEPLKIECALDDVADILYTTGTTGRKKGVVLTHLNIASAALNINAFLQTSVNDVEVVPVPLSHSFGLGRLRCWAQTGNTLVLEAGMNNPAGVLKTILDSRASGLSLVPAGFELMLKMTGDRLGEARGHLRYIEIGSAPMRPATRQKLMTLLPHTRICHHYGLTEASRAMFTEFHADADKPGAIGKPSPNVEAEIRDDAGRRLGPGEKGEIIVRGGMVMREYWRDPELTSKVLSEHGFHTGDLGYMDKDGYFYLVGRQSDIINVGGFKVSPEEVEAELNKFNGVEESACVGVPDPRGVTGECVKAYLVSKSEIDARDLIRWLRNRIEEYKIPSVFDRVEVIPKTASGKIQRHLLRDVVKANYGS